eukprot:scaffold293206_cov32-Tisochrysis_lutea.AAC.4
MSGGRRSYATAITPHAEIRDVNQSFDARRRVKGTKDSSKCLSGSICATLFNASIAFSRTNVSSTVARVSSGVSKMAACSGPPTQSTKLPSSSASATSTSSSSSIDSASQVRRRYTVGSERPRELG